MPTHRFRRKGTTRAELNMHLTASRDGEHLYQLKDGEKVDVLKRATAPKNPPKAVKPAAATPAKPSAAPNQKKTGATTTPATAKKPVSPGTPATSSAATSTTPAQNQPPPAPPVMEDWYLVRTSSGHAGWVLLRMIDLDVPVEVAQYAEGQRIIGYFVLNTVEEEGKQVPQYLMLLNDAQGRPAVGLQPDSRLHPQSRQASLRNRVPRARSGRLPAGEDRPSGLRQGRRPADLHHPQEERPRDRSSTSSTR